MICITTFNCKTQGHYSQAMFSFICMPEPQPLIAGLKHKKWSSISRIGNKKTSYNGTEFCGENVLKQLHTAETSQHDALQ